MHGGVVGGNKRQNLYYRCISYESIHKCDNGHLPKELIESQVFDSIRAMVQDEKVLEVVYNKARAAQVQKEQNKNTEINRITKEQQAIDHEITHILSAIKDTGHSRALLDDLKKLETKRDELAEQVVRLEVSPDVHQELITPTDIRRLLTQALEIDNDQEKGRMVREIIKRVDVSRIKKKLSGRIIVKLPDMSEISITI